MNDERYEREMALINKANEEALAYQESCIQLLQEKQYLASTFDFETIREFSSTLRENDNVHPQFTFQLKDSNNYCFLLTSQNIATPGRGQKYFVQDNYILGYAYTKISYPHIVVHPTNLELIVLSLFGRRDHELSNNKKFNRRFQIAIDAHSNKLIPFRDELAEGLSKFRELHLELNGHHCFFTASLKPFSKKEAQNYLAVSQLIHRYLS